MTDINGVVTRPLEEDTKLKSQAGKTFEDDNNKSWTKQQVNGPATTNASSLPIENGDDKVGNEKIKEESAIIEETSPISTISSSFSHQRTSMVTQDRKESLLIKARADRLAWIQKVPLPYKQSVIAKDGSVDVWKTDERLDMIRSSRVGAQVPSLTKVCSLLYGMEDNDGTTQANEIADRIGSLLEPLGTTKQDRDRAILSGNEMLDVEVATLGENDKQKTILIAYQQFMNNLQKSNNSTFVQSLRHFVRNIQQLDEDQKDVNKLATSMKTYIDSTYESMKSHPSWMNETSQETTRRSLESFLYGHCQQLLWSVLLEEEDNNTTIDEEWLDRVNSLQFVTPEHLEIECLIPEQQSTETEKMNVDELLKDPVDALLSVDRYYSPYEKLQRILAVYHGVNRVLSGALNDQSNTGTSTRQTKSDTGTKPKKLPSADDVLPTLILTVLRAKPNRMVSNLRFVEAFCPPEQLRGEAGYAYTNLYGAVQFLRDLNVDADSDSGPNSLSISAEEFRKGLIQCRASAESRLSEKLGASKEETTAAPMTPELSPTEVRIARLQGEDVNLEWALQWQRERQRSTAETDFTGKGENNAVDGATDMDALPESLPQGFSRSYSFLTTRPEDVRVTDLPQLLAEYKMMVHTTEILLAERNARIASEHKRQREEARKALEKTAAAVDLTLFRDTKGS